MSGYKEGRLSFTAAVGWLAALCLFCVFIYLIFSQAPPTSYVATSLLCVFFVIVTQIENIQKLSFGPTGIVADLDRKLRQAEATVDQLHKLAETFARIGILQISCSNRMDGLSSSSKEKEIDGIEAALRDIGIPSETIKRVLEFQRPYDEFDYYHWVMKPVWFSEKEKVKQSKEKFREQFPDKGIGRIPGVEDVEAFLDDYGWKKGEIAERLADWKQYRLTGKHQRPDLWHSRHGESVDAHQELLD